MDTEDPFSYRAATDFLTGNDDVHWRFGWGKAKKVSVYDMRNVRGLALRMYECRRFGGCGAGSFETLSSCAMFLNCTPNMDLEMLLRTRVAPVEYELATALFQDILARRFPP